mgnify:FL=1
MNNLLVLRDTFRAVYARYGAFLRPVFKVLLAFMMLIVIEKRIGYNPMLSNPAVILAASVVCGLLPWGAISFISGAFTAFNMFAVSPIMAAAFTCYAIIVFLLYYGYKPGTGIIISLVPLAFALKIPFLLPVVLGLSIGIYSAIPAAIGVIAWQFIHFFAVNAEAVTGSAASSAQMTSIAGEVLSNKYMLITLIAFVICIVVVNIISNSSINNSRLLSISIGTGILAVLMIPGGAVLGETSIIADIIGIIISYLLSFLYVQVFYCVDYSGTETLSYEDDDYYYYVKAVPKVKPYRNNR